MKKILKVLIVLLAIAILVLLAVSRYVDEKSDISRNIGGIWNGGPISTADYATITRSFEKYITMLNEKNYEDAYKMLFYEYKSYKDYETYYKEIIGKDYTAVYIEDIIRRTTYVYSIFLSNDEENLFILNQEETGFAVVPTTLIEYKELDKTIKKKNVVYKLKTISNYVDKYEIELELTNNTNKSINLSSIKLKNNAKLIKGDITQVSLEPKKTKTLKITYKTHLDFPTAIEITRYIENKKTDEKYILQID